jgi:DNA-binding CsgD family transcriptional regulator
MVHAVFQHVDWLHPADVSPAGRTAITLSPRERQVMMFLIDGNSRKEIAAKMGLSPHTLTDYLKEIYRKFEVRSRAELLAKFIRSETKLRL